jgi:hypothetical protein
LEIHPQSNEKYCEIEYKAQNARRKPENIGLQTVREQKWKLADSEVSCKNNAESGHTEEPPRNGMFPKFSS